jgi:hypothetical protein
MAAGRTADKKKANRKGAKAPRLLGEKQETRLEAGFFINL